MSVRCRVLSSAATIVVAVMSIAPANAQTDSVATTLKPVIVTVTRGTGRTVLGSPFAISITEPDSARPGQRHSSMDEVLALIPGVTAINRTNPAQDPRLSIRGFGARSAFGVRGIRVLRDGIPITLPDGQTPLDYLSLESVGRVEVLRGAASALYGNASGGVVDLHSAEPSASPLFAEATQWIGSSDAVRTTGSASGTRGATTYLGDVAYSRSNGPRAHSTQRGTTGFARLTTRNRGVDYSLVAMGLVNPLAENPGALTDAEMKQDAQMADALSVRRNARKSVNQIQIGVSASKTLKRSELSLSAFGGARTLDNPLTFAVVEVGRHTWGASGALRAERSLLGLRHSVSLGFDAQSQNDLRRNFAVCADTIPITTPTATCPFPGKDRGIVTIDQRELISGAGTYLSDEVAVTDRIGITAAVRADQVRFKVGDRLISNANPDDSGDRTMNAWSPTAGIIAHLGATSSLYANVATAFETPTATELGNHEDGSAGINQSLDPQRSVTGEAGLKGWITPSVRYELAAYRTSVRDELIPFEIPGSNGRRFFRNAGRTVRKGAEAGVDVSFKPISLMAAYTYSRFRFADYSVGADDFAGNSIPGIPASRLQGAVRADIGNGFVLFETEYSARTWLDDGNTVHAPAYAVTNLRTGLRPTWRRTRMSVIASLQNVFDRVYASSFAVNAARGKFYEPAPPRSLHIGLSWGAAL